MCCALCTAQGLAICEGQQLRRRIWCVITTLVGAYLQLLFQEETPFLRPHSISLSDCSTVGDKDVVALEVSRYESDGSSGSDTT